MGKPIRVLYLWSWDKRGASDSSARSKKHSLPSRGKLKGVVAHVLHEFCRFAICFAAGCLVVGKCWTWIMKYDGTLKLFCENTLPFGRSLAKNEFRSSLHKYCMLGNCSDTTKHTARNCNKSSVDNYCLNMKVQDQIWEKAVLFFSSRHTRNIFSMSCCPVRDSTSSFVAPAQSWSSSTCYNCMRMIDDPIFFD